MSPFVNALSISILATFLSSVSAGTIRFYPNAGCTGTIFQCGEINAGVCCSTSNVYATVKLLDTWDCTINAWSNYGCSGAQSGSAAVNECLSPSFAILSAKYFTIDHDNDRRDLNSTSSEDCVKPDSIVYLDDNNVEHTIRIPEGRSAVYEALAIEGDIATLKELQRRST
ncbi:hypothetical protein BDN70DRAFT_603702 [Pholiota conissans]|uniref:Uncharacterized protein n=1 Tax=Pholiota conissans TaxID=109636 RepID=A0A9P6CUI7_9AGAR|nr:hypothetical protein BDN70DRAFT_603702 [Pholiota conissans]